MTSYLSEKLRVLSAFAILLVLYIHTYFSEGEGMATLNFFENMLGLGVCLTAVPLFYAISGFLFFKGLKSVAGIGSKLRKRVKTLLVPYLLANLLTFVFYLLLNLLANKIPAIGNVVNFRVLDTVTQGIWPTIQLLFINPPIAFQLWFIRDLMIIMVFSPVIYLVLRFLQNVRFGGWIAALCAIILIALSRMHSLYASLLWFSVGGWAMMVNWRLTDTRKWPPIIAFAVCISLCIFKLLSTLQIPYINTGIIISGIIAIWLGYDMLAQGREVLTTPLRRNLVSYTFFIYLVHEPLLNIFKKLPLLINRSEPMLIVCYLLIPIVAYFCFMWLGIFLKRIIPKLYSIYTGGR